MSVNRLFEPESIAVIGASAAEGKIGHAAMANAHLFSGNVYPVNPNASGKLLDYRCYESIEDIDEDVDLALLCVPRHIIPDVIEQCGRAGVGGVVIYAAGFSEVSEEGAGIEAEIVSSARDYGIEVLGPNTSGFINTHQGVYASFVSDSQTVEPGNVSVVAQSGGINHVLMFMASAEGIGLSKAIGLGNACKTGFSEVISHLDADSDTESIILHVEGTDDARDLLETCRSAETPVTVYKVGQADVSEFAASHTGAMVGDYDLYEAGCAQYGVPMVNSCQELIDAGYTLSALPEPAGTNVALVTGQAGPGIAITDRLKGSGATLPSFSPETCDTIEGILPGLTYVSNPVDTGQPPGEAEYSELLETIAADDMVDILMVYQLYEERVDYPLGTLVRIVEEEGIPVVFATNGPTPKVDDGLAVFRSAGIPAFRSPERGADAVSILVEYAATNVGPLAPEAEVSSDD